MSKPDQGVQQEAGLQGIPRLAPVPKTYANAVNLSHTYYNFQLVLGVQVTDSTGEKPLAFIEPQAIVHMSPQHFKTLTRLMQEQLSKYEQQFGTIPDPPKVLEKPA